MDVDQVGRALSDVADATMSAALDVAIRKVAETRDGALDVRIAMVGMGRLGGREQGYGSDGDVLFVHDPLPGVADNVAAATALAVANELRRLLALTAPDPPLTVDADLRPEGRQGPLTRSLASYARYYERWSLVWEAQALLRARFVAGDADLGRRFDELIGPVRWPEELSAADVREIRRIKARVETERLPRGCRPDPAHEARARRARRRGVDGAAAPAAARASGAGAAGDRHARRADRRLRRGAAGP
jgi:glutamate-ammonia-ligase adenylyltransferase